MTSNAFMASAIQAARPVSQNVPRGTIAALLFADAEAAENRIEHVFNADAAGDSRERAPAGYDVDGFLRYARLTP